VVGLKDSDGDGVADQSARFGASLNKGGHGGTGIALWHGSLFVEEHDTIVRYPLRAGNIAPSGPPVTVLSGLPLAATIRCTPSPSKRRAISS
jgi:hypothetical protein